MNHSIWAKHANDLLNWSKPFTISLTKTSQDKYNWFADGRLNASVCCLDQHIEAGLGSKPACIFATETQQYSVTYNDLLTKVKAFAAGLRRLGVCKGDRVVIYLSNSEESVISMLACARIGAIHSVVFAGFSAQALAWRINHTQAKVLIAGTEIHKNGKTIDLSNKISNSLLQSASRPELITVGVLEKVSGETFQEVLDSGRNAPDTIEFVSGADPLFILYTSGTTGEPKGIVHSTAGYLTYVATTLRDNFQLAQDDVHFCSADVGWITGHSYCVYAPLVLGSASVLYSGSPLAKQGNRLWELADKTNARTLYTAPTVVRLLQSKAPRGPKKYDLKNLKVVGSVGEPLNPSAFEWLANSLPKSVQIIDTWWQTETGGNIIGGLAAPNGAAQPGIAGKPFPGVHVAVENKELYITSPWPGMLIDCWKNSKRYRKYFSDSSNGNHFKFKTDDIATLHPDGSFSIIGRNDDVINSKGVRLGSIEIENALNRHPHVMEVAVIARPDRMLGQKIVAYIVANSSELSHAEQKRLTAELKNFVVEEIGYMAVPHTFIYTKSVPKTQSGKIRRAYLRKNLNRK